MTGGMTLVAQRAAKLRLRSCVLASLTMSAPGFTITPAAFPVRLFYNPGKCSPQLLTLGYVAHLALQGNVEVLRVCAGGAILVDSNKWMCRVGSVDSF